MGKGTKDRNNFVDALDRENRYAVLVKSGRVQILVRVTAKQLRKRGKRGWQLFGTVDDATDAWQILTKTIQGAIESLESLDEATEKRRKKQKRSKTAGKD